MRNFLADLRFGLRMLRKSPGFALTTIAVLALGIGANAAVFSVVDAVLLRSLPLRDPERVVMLWEKNPALGGSIGERVPSAYVNFLEWQRQATQFEGIAGFEELDFDRVPSRQGGKHDGAPNQFDRGPRLNVDLVVLIWGIFEFSGHLTFLPLS